MTCRTTPFPAPPKEPCVKFSLTRLNHIPSPDGMRRAKPDASDESDNSKVLIVDEDTQAVVAPVVTVLLRDEAGQPLHHELVEVVEHRRRIPFGKVATPPHQVSVQVFSHEGDGKHLPPAGGVRPDRILGSPHCSLGGPSSTKVRSLAGEALYSAMVEPEKIEPGLWFSQIHDVCLRFRQGQPQLGEDLSQGREGRFGSLFGRAQHHEIIGVPDEDAESLVLCLPLAIEAMQHHVRQNG
jgi:hypothetical protein